jgi:hypothetical protein
MKTKILTIPKNTNSGAVSSSPDTEIWKQLKQNFQDSVTSKNFEGGNFSYYPYELEYSEGLISFPKCSNYMIRTAKQLVVGHGIMSSPSP